jgi:hypothetical protein
VVVVVVLGTYVERREWARVGVLAVVGRCGCYEKRGGQELGGL